MLTERQVATLQAALLYWQEEMCPHGESGMRPYLESPGLEPLSAAETAELCDQLKHNVCYAVYDSAKERLAGSELFQECQEAQLAAGSLTVAAVLLP